MQSAISDNENIFECNYCGAVWRRLKPTMKNGRMANLPDKLRKLLKKK